MIVYGFIYDKIKNIPSIEVSDKDKLKKKTIENLSHWY